MEYICWVLEIASKYQKYIIAHLNDRNSWSPFITVAVERKSRPAMSFGMPASLKPTAESILDNWV